MSILITIALFILRLIAILLLLLLAFVLLILLSPLTYELEGVSEEKRLRGRVKLTYLFRILSAELIVTKEGNQSPVQIREVKIFGISPTAIRNRRREREKEKRAEEKKKRLRELKERDPKQYEALKQEAYERKIAKQQAKEPELKRQETRNLNEEEGKRPASVEESNEGEQEKQSLPTVTKVSSEETSSMQVSSAKQHDSSREAIRNLWNRFYGGMGKIILTIWKGFTDILFYPVNIWASLFERYHGYLILKERVGRYVSFLRNPSFSRAVQKSWRELKRILRHMMPRHLSGHMIYGTEDPAYTGQILAVLSLLGPIYKGDFLVQGDFDREDWYARGDVLIQGRIYPVTFIVTVLRLLINKDIRFIIHFIRHPEEE